MNEIDPKLVGKRLIRLRGKKTQEEVAKILGISSQALSNYELGLRLPRDNIKKKIATYYGRTVQEIFYDWMLTKCCHKLEKDGCKSCLE